MRRLLCYLKSLAALYPAHRAGLVCLGSPFALAASAALCVAGASAGCNIVQGFQDAGDTLFPQQSTHLGAPGLRLAAGGYQNLDLAAGVDLYLLARGADDKSQLFAMRYADPQPCAIPSVGRYLSTHSAQRSLPLLSYFRDGSSRGTLHFADASCRLYDLNFADARLPIAETDSSVVVWASQDLWLATPETGTQQRLAANVEDVIGRVLGNRYALRTGGHIEVFASDWLQHASFGEQVVRTQPAGRTLFYTDKAGVHRLIASPASVHGVADELLGPDGCALGTQDNTWVTFRAPCSGGPVSAVHEPTGHQFMLPFDADPEHLKLVPALHSPAQDPIQDPFWFFGLRDGASEDALHTLVVRTPDGRELTLGAQATLDQLRLVESDSETHGYALVDVVGGSGRYLWWNAEGQTKILAEHVLPQPSRLIVDFDGSVGKLAVTSGDRLVVLAPGVPWPAFEYRDASQQWTALFHDLDFSTQSGQLSAFYGSLDTLRDTPLDQPLVAPELVSIAPRVGVFRTSSLDEVLSGVIYLADFDVKAGTGRLEYRSLELRFTGLVNFGVSDYRVFQDQVLYAIPRGANAGIWLVSGK